MSIRDARGEVGVSKTAVARQLKSLGRDGPPLRAGPGPGRPRALTRAEEDALAAFCVYLAQGNGMGQHTLVHRAANELRARRSSPMRPAPATAAGSAAGSWIAPDLTLRNIPRAERQYRVDGDGDEVVEDLLTIATFASAAPRAASRARACRLLGCLPAAATVAAAAGCGGGEHAPQGAG